MLSAAMPIFLPMHIAIMVVHRLTLQAFPSTFTTACIAPPASAALLDRHSRLSSIKLQVLNLYLLIACLLMS